MKKWVLWMLLCLFVPVLGQAQHTGGKCNVTGIVIDKEDNSPIMQGTVQILSLPDSAMVVGKSTKMDGSFTMHVRPGKYLLKVSYVGYRSTYKSLLVNREKKNISLGKIFLESDAIMLEGTTVVAQAAEVAVSEDTVVYNSSAYRLPEGSSLEALVKKLPGAEVDENGKITINGKEVKKIMVDGKEFFANDPNVAMKNLPVDIVDKVKAYDRQSDMARVTGIADGEEETVLDLTVKKGMNKGWFGNIDGAVGSHDRYSGKMMLNRFADKKQFTVMGGSNNVNDMDFPGGGYSSGRWGAPNGMNKTHRGGFNFAVETDKWETGGSLDFSMTDADVRSKEASETFVSSTTSSFRNALKLQNNKNWTLNGDFRLEWKPSEMTTMIFRPHFNVGNTDNNSSSKEFTFNEDPEHSTDELMDAANIVDLVPEETIVNTIIRQNATHNDDYSAGGKLFVNQRLGKDGRNLSLNLKTSYSHGELEQFSTSDIDYFQVSEQDRSSILNRYIFTPTTKFNNDIKLSYSEPIGKNMFVQLEYAFQYKRNKSDNSTYDMPDDWTVAMGEAGRTDGTFNKDLSKYAVYHYYNHQVNVNYKWITKSSRLNVGVSFLPQNTKLDYKKGELDTISKRKVFVFTPMLDYRFRFSKTTMLHVTYRGRSQQPNMIDLLPTRDDTNPLNVKVGNPNLKPAFVNNMYLMFNSFDPKKQRSVMVHGMFRHTMNNISNRRIYDESTGGYINRPENINGNWMANGMVGGNFALKNKRFTVGAYTSGGFNRMTSYISNQKQAMDTDKNITKQLNLGERLRGTYRNDWWEVSLNGSIRYKHSRNSYQEANNMDTYDFSYGASTNVNLPWNMSISTDISQSSRRGYTESSMNRDELIWNAQIAQNFLKGNAATVSIQFYDILKNQSNISRVISAAQRSDNEYNAIYSYCMVHFIYRLNIFGGVKKGGRQDRGGYGGRGYGGHSYGHGGGYHRY